MDSGFCIKQENRTEYSRRTELVGLTSVFSNSEVEGRAGLWRNAEVDRSVLGSLVLVNSSQNLNYL